MKTRVLTDEEKLLIANLYEMGKTDQEVADIIHTTRQTLSKILKLQANNLAYTKKKVANDKVEESLYSQAKKGNTTAMIFWLCNRDPARWQNVQHIKQEQIGNLNVIHQYGRCKKH